MNQITQKKVLYVDDEPINLELFRAHFKKDYEVETALSADEALKLLREQDIHVIVTDLKMPGLNGMEFIELIKKRNPEKVCILLTAFTDPEVMIKAMNEGKVFKYMVKPWLKKDLSMVIEHAFQSIS
ncbi:MAG: response regulator [Marinilabiliaceae bacterium]|nr:response regulator [Marinilabiliaceae bacterium]